jgi:RNA polymerase sigma-70 factor (ECF subfamily)
VVDVPESQSDAQISADLAMRIRNADRSAEEELVRRYGPGLLRVLTRQTRGDVEIARDLRQDTFETALAKLRAGQLENPASIAAYLRGIAERLATGHYRKDVRRATTPDSEMIERQADQRQGPFESLSKEQVQSAVRALIEELPTPRDRDILMAVYVREEDKDETCARLEIDSTHFNRVLFRAKQRFRELLVQRGKFRLVE